MKTGKGWLRSLKSKTAQRKARPPRRTGAAGSVPLRHSGSGPEAEIEKAFAEYLKTNAELPEGGLTAGGRDARFRFRVGERVEVGRLLFLSKSGVITARTLAKQEGTGQTHARYRIRLDSGEELEKDERELYH